MISAEQIERGRKYNKVKWLINDRYKDLPLPLSTLNAGSEEFFLGVWLYQMVKSVSPVDGMLGPITEKALIGEPDPVQDEPAAKIKLPGIDVSRYQGKSDELDWEKAKEMGSVFAIIRSSQGRGYVDPEFYENWDNARQEGMVVGAYHVIDFTHDIEDQVEHYYKTVTKNETFGPNFCLPPVLDVETSKIDEVEPDVAHHGIIKWLDGVSWLFNVKPIVYLSRRGVRHLKGHTDGIMDFPLWVVDWGVGRVDPILPYGFDSWTFWQYTDSGDGKANGFKSSGLDLDWFNGDREELRKLLAWPEIN
jgi:lysozyme